MSLEPGVAATEPAQQCLMLQYHTEYMGMCKVLHIWGTETMWNLPSKIKPPTINLDTVAVDWVFARFIYSLLTTRNPPFIISRSPSLPPPPSEEPFVICMKNSMSY